jgi:hypothetical protein
MPGDPFAEAERLIRMDETQRAVVGLAWAIRCERRLPKAEHAKILLAGLIAGRRGHAATRAWAAELRAASTVQTSLGI